MAAAFHHLPAAEMEDLESGLEADVLVCSDHPEATAADRARWSSTMRRAAAARRGQPDQAGRDRGVHRGLHHPQHPPQGALDAAARPGSERCGSTTRARREVVAFEPGPARDDVLVRHHALRRRAPRARRGLPLLRHAAAPPAGRRARDAGACATSPTSTTTSCARPASSACTTSTSPPRRWPASTPTWALLEPPAGLLRAAGHLGHLRDPVADRRGARGRPRLRVRRLGLLQRGDASPSSAGSAATAATEMLELAAEHGGQPGRPQQARPARLRALAAVAARRAGLGVALGPGAARAGTSSARRWPCASSARRSTSTAAAATSCSRTTSARRRSPSR